MKAIQITGPGEIRVVEKEKPVAQEGEALLQVLYGGICGADLASYTGNQPFTTYPRIPGHEFSARVMEVPDNERGIRAGDIVTCNPYFNCGSCYACQRGLVNACHSNQTMGVQRDGAFQEYITMPVQRIIPGKGLSAKELALIEPFSISCHALSRAPIHKGDRLLIMGAGPIGLFALLRAKSLGAKVLIADLLESRLTLAKSYGADAIVPVNKENLHEASSAFTGGGGFDVCVEACGAPETFLNCIQEAAHGANLILIGNGKREVTFLHSVLLQKELNVFGSRNALTADFETLIDLANTGAVPLTRMISGVYPLMRAPDAFEALKHNNGTLAKLLVQIGDE